MIFFKTKKDRMIEAMRYKIEVLEKEIMYLKEALDDARNSIGNIRETLHDIRFTQFMNPPTSNKDLIDRQKLLAEMEMQETGGEGAVELSWKLAKSMIQEL